MKKFGRKVLAAVLTVAAVAGLAACGKKEELPDSAESGKETVYVADYAEFTSDASDQLRIEEVRFANDTLYFLGGHEDEETHNYELGLYELKLGETKAGRLPWGEEENSSISAFTTDEEGNLLLCVYSYSGPAVDAASGDTGAASDTDAASDIDAASGTDSSSGTDAAETGDADGEGSQTGEAGNEEETAGASGEITLSTSIVRIDKEGNRLDSFSLDEVLREAGNPYVQQMETDKEGNVYFAAEKTVYAVDGEGKLLFSAQAGSWITSMGKMKDGTVFVCAFGAGGMEARPVDIASQKLGDAYPDMIPAGHYQNLDFGQGAGEDVIYYADNKVCAYHVEEAKRTELFDWMDVDINDADVRGIFRLPDGRIASLLSTNEAVYLSEKDASTVKEREKLILGTMHLSPGLKRRIVDFNKTNPDYRIEIKNYSDMSEDYETAVNQMNADIISGDGPDIMDFSSRDEVSINQYASKGVLEDLNPYLDGDEELKREDYLENVLKSYERGGKMYGISSRFCIPTVLAKTSDMGGKTGWTVQEMMEYIDSKPEAKEVIQYASSDTMLEQILSMNLDSYVDWSTGKCGFDTEKFINLLEFCARFPSPDKISYDENGPNVHDKIQDGSLLLVNISILGMEEYQMYEQVFGEPITFIGYPTDDGNGSWIMPLELLGMSASSEHKDGVWQFLRMGLTEKYQDAAYEENQGAVMMYGFPVLKSALDNVFEEAMKAEYDVGPNGEKVERPKMSYGIGSGEQPFIVQIYASTQEEVDAVRRLIENTTKGYQFDGEMFNIIKEEAAPYFQGQKKADEAAAIIQSRVQIYVNENK